LDTTFGTNGIAGYRQSCGNDVSLFGTTLFLKTIQPDGKILGTDIGQSLPRLTRFNPNGSPDLSFGNENSVGGAPFAGSLNVNVLHYNNANSRVFHEHVIVRPNGRLLLFGYSFPFQATRAVVSQQNTVFENGIYSDFTNDGKTDIGVFRPSAGAWFYLNSANNQSNGIAFGLGTDKIAPADYDGDGKTDVAVFRDGIWYLQQSTKGFTGISFGTTGDLPRPGDFDGDGLADISVFRPSTGIWYRLNSSNGQFVGIAFGQNGDVPLLADFDADGKTDIAVFRQGFWYYLQSSDGQFRAVQFGASTDIPTVGDYDGDSRADVSVFRASNGTWYRINSSNGAFVFNQFGQNGDRPVPGDYDNDGKNDLAIFRSGVWYGLRSGDNSVFGVAYGAATDIPIPAAYLP
ncbi:MAG: FG-GAP-like repeat-containing protein, partial [Pyrinomonadaceae bacterium]|nr:FG-GAP-like repeat-containing protein [Pyrinomonadaceae bacterium]